MKRAQLVTSTDYAHPKRPAAFTLANRIGRRRDGAKDDSFDYDALVAAARRSTGLSDFGEGTWSEPLRVLLASIDDEARLHPIGRAIMRGRIVAMLENRLRIKAAFEADPSVLTAQVPRPIVIAGLQRTGTTMLHRLLAADPRARSLASWEALHPAPMPGEGRSGSFRRRAEAKIAERGLKAIAPEFFAIHPVEAEAPEEDVLLLDHTFLSTAPEATMHVPTYARWLETADNRPAYRYLRRCMQLLGWQRTGQFWVLKTPHHLEHLGTILDVFPDAVIVQTHRDPQATIGSFCSMVAHGRGVFSDDVDPREIGRHWLRKTRRMLDEAAAVRDARPDGTYVDVSYYDVLSDPLAEVRRIYAAAGLELTQQAETAMRAVIARDVKDRHGKHVYRTRDFGISPTMVDETFDAYRARHHVPREKRVEDYTKEQAAASGVGHTNPASAILTGVLDLFSKEENLVGLRPDVRLDGKTAMVTGANAGLGRSIAIDLARRGARVILACRSGIPEAGEEIAAVSGSSQVEMLKVDLSDLDSVVALTDELARRGETLDLVVCNAGLMPSRGQGSAQGFEVMFAVHYLANHLLLRRLFESGVIPNDVYARNGRRGTAIPRVVLVSSEAHRSSEGLHFDRLGAFVDYGITDGVKHYGDSKLALCTFATELARRMQTTKGTSVAVHSLCPGPVDSKIARNAPAWLEPVIGGMMHAFFRSPDVAIEPVIYLSAAPDIAGDSGWYMHLMRKKTVSPLAANPENGRKLWEWGEATLAGRLK